METTRDHYLPEDRKRLSPRNQRVADLMRDGKWRNPYDIGRILEIPNAGTVTSRLRDLKASGVYDLERRRSPKAGVHEYRLLFHKPEQLSLLEGIPGIVAVCG